MAREDDGAAGALVEQDAAAHVDGRRDALAQQEREEDGDAEDGGDGGEDPEDVDAAVLAREDPERDGAGEDGEGGEKQEEDADGRAAELARGGAGRGAPGLAPGGG